MTMATKIVRRVMKSFGKSQVWTNKYKNCRTVKCYQSSVDDGMLKSIYEALDRNGVGYSVSVKKISCPEGYNSGSLIIRLPL